MMFHNSPKNICIQDTSWRSRIISSVVLHAQSQSGFKLKIDHDENSLNNNQPDRPNRNFPEFPILPTTTLEDGTRIGLRLRLVGQDQSPVMVVNLDSSDKKNHNFDVQKGNFIFLVSYELPFASVGSVAKLDETTSKLFPVLDHTKELRLTQLLDDSLEMLMHKLNWDTTLGKVFAIASVLAGKSK